MARAFEGAKSLKYIVTNKRTGVRAWRVATIYPDQIRRDRNFVIDESDPNVAKKKAEDYHAAKVVELARLDDVTWERAVRLYRVDKLADGNKVASVDEDERRIRELLGPVLSARCAAMTAKKMAELYHGKWQGDVLLEHGLKNRPTRRRRGDPKTWKACELRCKCKGDGPPLLPDSHRNYLLVTGTFLRWAQGRGFVADDPTEKTKDTPELRGTGKRNHGGLGRNRLGKKELRALYYKAFDMALAGDLRALAVLFALLFGMRSNEVRTRQCRFIDDVTWTVEVDPDAAKTDESDRDNVIPEPLRPLIAARLASKGNDEFFFADGDDPAPNKDWLRDGLHAVCDAAGVKRVHPHSLRGAHEDLAKLAGQTAAAICAQLGHKDPKTGDRSYTSEMGRRGARRAKQKIVLDVLEGGKKSAAGGKR